MTTELESQPTAEMGHLGRASLWQETSPEVRTYSSDRLGEMHSEATLAFMACDILHFFLSPINSSLLALIPQHRFHPLPGKEPETPREMWL